MRYISNRKPEKCPECGSRRIADILYGMPDFSEDLLEEMNSGKIVIGGCCISNNDPTWQCTDVMHTSSPSKKYNE